MHVNRLVKADDDSLKCTSDVIEWGVATHFSIHTNRENRTRIGVRADLVVLLVVVDLELSRVVERHQADE